MKRKNYWVFNSLDELARTLEAYPQLDNRGTSSENNWDNGEWCDTQSYSEALQAMLTGWEPKGIEKSSVKLNGNSFGAKRSSELSVVGHQVVVPLYLQGVPNNMITHKHKISNKIVNIFYSLQVSGNVDGKYIVENCHKLFNYIVSLESKGYRVNLWAGEVQLKDRADVAWAVRLKHDREVFNSKKLYFPICSSSFTRRIDFRVKERLFEKWIGLGYGSSYIEKYRYDWFAKNVLRINNYELWSCHGKEN